MNTTLLDLLSCPTCRGPLEIVSFDGNGEGASRAESSRGDELCSGLLKCKCGAAFPVIDGVPRLLEDGLRAFPEFLSRYYEKIRSELPIAEPPQLATAQRKGNDYDYIQEAFSREWQIFNYAEDNTWGWTLNERKRVFLSDIGLTEDQVTGKLLLDAGCGNGTLTAALGSLGMEVVGIDLNNGLEAANSNRVRYAGDRWGAVHYVQGNLFNPPLKHSSFDLIYSSGVIHHTPDSKETFNRLVPLVRKGGRMYVWVYSQRNFMVRAFFDSGRQLKKFMTLQSLLNTCRMIAPFYKLGTESLNLLGVMKFRKRSVREITLDLFDAFAPQYNHRHTESEVQGWFRETGFTNITLSGVQKHGFGVYGDMT